MDFQKFYEWYHRNRKLPKRIITNKNFTYRIVLEILDKYCKPEDVLDVGCGVGTIDFYLAKKGKNITGVEISKRAVDIAQKSLKIFGLGKNIEFKKVNFFKSRLQKKYSFVICSEVLEHLPDDKKAINKIFGIIKRNGMLLLTVPSVNAPLTKFGVIEAFDKRSGHLRRYTIESAEILLKETGFKIILSKKAEGIIRNSLFVFRWNFIIRIANRFAFISNLITFFDNISLKLFGESDVILIARKI